MSDVEKALDKIRAAIGKDCHIIRHYIRNRSVVGIIAKRNVGVHSVPVSPCIHVAVIM